MRMGLYIDIKTGYMINVIKLCYDYSKDKHYVLFSDGSHDDLLIRLNEFNKRFVELNKNKRENNE